MGIPAVGPDVIVTPAEQFPLAPQAVEPLRTALLNANWLYLHDWAPLVDVCPWEPAAMGRSAVCVVPVRPSVDGLPYDFHVEAVCSANANLTVGVEYTTNYTGVPTAATPTVWVPIYTTTTPELAGARAAQITTGQVIPAGAIALRFIVTASFGTLDLHHLLVFPHPTILSAGTQPSGFCPYDDGLLVAGVAPVHTEFLDRCMRNTKNVLRDRQLQRFGMIQDEAVAAVDWALTGQTSWIQTVRVRLWFPYQGPTVLVTVRSLVTVSAGAGADLVQLAQVADPDAQPIASPGVVTLSGSIDGMIDQADLRLQLQGDGRMRYADVVARIRTTPGDTTRVHALVAHWRRGDT